DSLEYPGYGYDRGVLPEGPLPDGAWERRGDVVEVRIPWNLVGVTDPSTRTVRTGGVDADGALATARVEAIRLVPAARDAGGTWRMPSTAGAVAFAWEGWEQPQYRTRARPTFDVMRGVFRELEQGAVAISAPAPVAAAPVQDALAGLP